MYPGLFTSVNGESDDSEPDGDNSSTFSEREEIEQALYAQIHYCQIEQEDEKHIGLDSSTTRQDIYSECATQVEEKQQEKIPGEKSSHDDTCIVLSSSVEDSPMKDNRKSFKSHSKKIKSKFNQNEVITIDTLSDAISISSEGHDEETGYSSDCSFNLSSDCMALDESCDDMGDIVVNVDKSQRQMLNHLTVRDIKEKDEAGKWVIIDEDRFQGNPLLGRYYRSSSVRCHNCNEVGHLSKVCPKPRKEIVCYLCGEEGHHGKACTKPVCFNCNTPGHMFASCKEPKRSKHMDCYRCEMYGHASYECPEIWRQFHLTTISGQLIRGNQKENKKRHCPNCAGDDHFDFECEEERMDRHGLPICPLIKQYRKADLKSQKRNRERNQDESEVPKKKQKTESVHYETSKSNSKYSEDFDRASLDFSSVKLVKRKDSTNKSFKEKIKEYKLENASLKKKKKKDDSKRKGKHHNIKEDFDYGNDSNKKFKNKNKSEKYKLKQKNTKKKDKKKSSKKMHSEQSVLEIKKKKKSKKDKKTKKKSNFVKERGFKMRDGLFQISFKNS